MRMIIRQILFFFYFLMASYIFDSLAKNTIVLILAEQNKSAPRFANKS